MGFRLGRYIQIIMHAQGANIGKAKLLAKLGAFVTVKLQQIGFHLSDHLLNKFFIRIDQQHDTENVRGYRRSNGNRLTQVDIARAVAIDHQAQGIGASLLHHKRLLWRSDTTNFYLN